MVSFLSTLKYAAISVTFVTIFFSLSITPFGFPVVPDVHIISAGCSSGSLYVESDMRIILSSPSRSVIMAVGSMVSIILLL